MITGAPGANQTITAGGALTIAAPAKNPGASVVSGLGDALTFVGASVSDDSAVYLPSGTITLHATTGDLTIGSLATATLDVSGQAKTFFDLTKYTSGGQINLIADQGNISVGSKATITVAAQAGGGNAGALSISAPQGGASLAGSLMGQAGKGGEGGIFSMDVGSIAAVTVGRTSYSQGSLDSVDAVLDAGAFNHSITIRDRNDTDVTLSNTVTADAFNVSADTGSITISGVINASDVASTDASGNPISIGGSISLQAAGSVTLLSGAVLNVAAQNYSDSGKGGSVDLEAGSDIQGVYDRNAVVDIQAGSTIDLSVAVNPAPGNLAGTLHLRAPQVFDSNGNPVGVQINPINGQINGASSITVEGYAIFNTASDNGSIDDQESNVLANGQAFAANTAAISSRLLANNPGLASALVIEPGAEIINPSGDLTLADSWDLSTYRFGPNNVAGDLTLRAAGNVIFQYDSYNQVAASLSDGFTGATYLDTLLPAGSTSWSYRITAGANFSAANFSAVLPLSSLGAQTGSILVGQGAPALPASSTTDTNPGDIVPFYFEVIRTGNGDITLSAGRDVQLLDSLASIYTAGIQAPDIANFQTPLTDYYAPQYSYQGGNVSISAQNDITHLLSKFGTLVPDSSLELPTSWLNRCGFIDPATGQFGVPQRDYAITSTSWWVDFSNFFEGVGALGGGNVSMAAGHDISNVDAVIPTNGRMPDGTPNASSLVELGGGDLLVRAGHDINGGVYYVERGRGVLNAGDQILTNSTRATLADNLPASFDTNSSTWLPTTLFLGVGAFDVSAAGDILLGSVANPFLLPQDFANLSANKTYFSTYGLNDQVDVSSLNGNVAIRGGSGNGTGTLAAWYRNIFLTFMNEYSYANSQPWLTIDETIISPDAPLIDLLPPTLRVTSFSADIDIAGTLTLSPAPDGTLDLAAAGSIKGLQPTDADLNSGVPLWTEGVINVSDANPALIPSITSPLGIPGSVTGSQLNGVDSLFADSGSLLGVYGVIQTKEELHAPTFSTRPILYPSTFTPRPDTSPALPCTRQSSPASWPVPISPTTPFMCKMTRAPMSR